MRDADEPDAAPQRGTPSGDPKERKAFLLRLQPELYEELRAWASADLRSLNGHIEYLLREAVRRKRGTKSGS